MHTCVNKKEQITDLDFHSTDWRAPLQHHSKQSKSNQAKWWPNVTPCNHLILFCVEKAAYKQNARHKQHQEWRLKTHPNKIIRNSRPVARFKGPLEVQKNTSNVSSKCLLELLEKKRNRALFLLKKEVLHEVSNTTQIQQLAPKLLFLLDLCAKWILCAPFNPSNQESEQTLKGPLKVRKETSNVSPKCLPFGIEKKEEKTSRMYSDTRQ